MARFRLPTPEEFAQAWNDPGVAADLRPPLVAAPAHSLKGVDLPDEANGYLAGAGLPRWFEPLGMGFALLARGVLPLPEVRPDAVDNGIEFPRRRYDLYYAVGDDGSEHGSTICVERRRGRVVRLDYGQGTFWQTVRHEGGGGSLYRTGHPVLDGTNPIGPYFVSSSVPQLAALLLCLRDACAQTAPSTPRRQARLLRTALRRIDEAAVVHPDGVWKHMLQRIEDGIDE